MKSGTRRAIALALLGLASVATTSVVGGRQGVGGRQNEQRVSQYEDSISRPVRPNARPAVAPAQPHVHTRSIVDGASDPDSIPNEVAYSLFLRMTLSDGSVDGETRRLAYIKHVLREARSARLAHVDGVGGAVAPAHEPSALDTEALAQDADAVLAVLRSLEPVLRDVEARRRAGSVSSRADVGNARSGMVELAKSLFAKHLSSDASADLAWYVETRFKTKVKIVY